MEEVTSRLQDFGLRERKISISRELLGGFSFERKGTVNIPGYPVGGSL